MTTTPNFDLNLSTDNSAMSDTDSSFNDNWVKIAGSVVPPIVDELPITDFSYSVGDKVYHTGTKSIYVLFASNAQWGNFWKPIQARYGPWIQLTSTTIDNPLIYNIGPAAIQYKICNQAMIYWRGCVQTNVSGGFVDYGTATNPKFFKDLPPAVGPQGRLIFPGAVYPVASSSSKPTISQIFYQQGVQAGAIWNPNSSTYPATQLFLDGLTWAIGSGDGLNV